MRRSNLTADDILKAEQAKEDRHQARKNGYSKMEERDRGYQRLSNGSSVRWHIEPEWSEEVNGISTLEATVAPGVFEIDGKEFDAEELRKWLRWA